MNKNSSPAGWIAEGNAFGYPKFFFHSEKVQPALVYTTFCKIQLKKAVGLVYPFESHKPTKGEIP